MSNEVAGATASYRATSLSSRAGLMLDAALCSMIFSGPQSADLCRTLHMRAGSMTGVIFLYR